MSIIELFRRPDPVADELASLMDLASADLEAPPASILDRSASVVAGFLDHARTEEARIVNEIARLSEQLRQTRLAISAFEPALKVLDEGYDPADDARKSYDAAIEAKRKARA